MAENGVDVGEERFETPATEFVLDDVARDVTEPGAAPELCCNDDVDCVLDDCWLSVEVVEPSVGVDVEVWDGSGAPPLEVVEGRWIGEGSAEGDSDGEGRGSGDGEEGGGGGVVEEVDAAMLLLWQIFFAWPGGGLDALFP